MRSKVAPSLVGSHGPLHRQKAHGENVWVTAPSLFVSLLLPLTQLLPHEQPPLPLARHVIHVHRHARARYWLGGLGSSRDLLADWRAGRRVGPRAGGAGEWGRRGARGPVAIGRGGVQIVLLGEREEGTEERKKERGPEERVEERRRRRRERMGGIRVGGRTQERKLERAEKK